VLVGEVALAVQRQGVQAVRADIQADKDDQRAGGVGRTPRESGKARPSARDVADAERRRDADRDQGDRQPEAETQDQRSAEGEFLELKAQ
jgi:hypothetical protein